MEFHPTPLSVLFVRDSDTFILERERGLIGCANYEFNF